VAVDWLRAQPGVDPEVTAVLVGGGTGDCPNTASAIGSRASTARIAVHMQCVAAALTCLSKLTCEFNNLRNQTHHLGILVAKLLRAWNVGEGYDHQIVCGTSGLPQTADISGPGRHFAFVPTTDIASQ
jgi:hypothetical protein